MDEQDQIISYLKINGPVTPTQIGKLIHSTILIASVHLSDLASQKKVKISSLKVGGTPLYYLPEHREKLQNFVQNFDGADQETIKRLREKQVLREKEQDLLTRLSLRNIADFAIPLNVTINNSKEIFWKWYLIEDETALQIIKQIILLPPIEKKEEEPKPLKKLELQEKLEQEKLIEKAVKPAVTKTKKIAAVPKGKIKKAPGTEKILPVIHAFFKEKEISIENQETVKKEAEFNLILNVPSVIGQITYFCKVKNKRSSDEKDLSLAYLEAQAKKLPLLFIHTGGLTKKAQELLDSGQFQNVLIKKLN